MEVTESTEHVPKKKKKRAVNVCSSTYMHDKKNGISASKKPKNIILVERNVLPRGCDLWIVLGGGD